MSTRWSNQKSVDRRKQGAANRQAERNLLTPAQQIDRLNQKFGAGVGARKERTRLRALIGAV